LSSKEKTSKIGMFSCAGGSNTGQMSLKAVVEASKKLGRDRASLLCLAGVSSQIPGIVKGAKECANLISVDGCETQCASKTLKKFGLKPGSEVVVTRDYEVKKNHDLADDHDFEKVRNGVEEKVRELMGEGR